MTERAGGRIHVLEPGDKLIVRSRFGPGRINRLAEVERVTKTMAMVKGSHYRLRREVPESMEPGHFYCRVVGEYSFSTPSFLLLTEETEGKFRELKREDDIQAKREALGSVKWQQLGEGQVMYLYSRLVKWGHLKDSRGGGDDC